MFFLRAGECAAYAAQNPPSVISVTSLPHQRRHGCSPPQRSVGRTSHRRATREPIVARHADFGHQRLAPGHRTAEQSEGAVQVADAAARVQHTAEPLVRAGVVRRQPGEGGAPRRPGPSRAGGQRARSARRAPSASRPTRRSSATDPGVRCEECATIAARLARAETEKGRRRRPFFPADVRRAECYCTAFIMSKIGRYMATTMPPTTTPRITIMIGSMSERSALTATSTSSS
jgi:hypothetical protein